MRSACDDAGVGGAAPLSCHAAQTNGRNEIRRCARQRPLHSLALRALDHARQQRQRDRITAVQANVNCHAACAPLRCTLGSPKGTLTFREIQSNRRSNPSRLLWSNAPSSTGVERPRWPRPRAPRRRTPHAVPGRSPATRTRALDRERHQAIEEAAGAPSAPPHAKRRDDEHIRQRDQRQFRNQARRQAREQPVRTARTRSPVPASTPNW